MVPISDVMYDQIVLEETMNVLKVESTQYNTMDRAMGIIIDRWYDIEKMVYEKFPNLTQCEEFYFQDFISNILCSIPRVASEGNEVKGLDFIQDVAAAVSQFSAKICSAIDKYYEGVNEEDGNE